MRCENIALWGAITARLEHNWSRSRVKLHFATAHICSPHSRKSTSSGKAGFWNRTVLKQTDP